MAKTTLGFSMTWALSALLLAAPAALAQEAAPSPATQPSPAASTAPPPSVGMRLKISAGDLPSAESMLEVYRAGQGEDDHYLTGLSWLARGALLLGDKDKANRYATDVRKRCSERMTQGRSLDQDPVAEIALGAAIEVQAQLIERDRGAGAAADFVRDELTRLSGPVALRARLNKRINLLTLAGTPAPEIAAEDFIGERPPSLAALRGQAVVLFLWAKGCPDCDAQAAALARVQARLAEKGLRVVALTRYYRDEGQRSSERGQIENAWKTVYAALDAVPVVISTASMERYGGSSTPTFVFVDRSGIVRNFTPTRLTEADLEREAAKIIR
jgi:thiol-disulfide isomerase/thioredoxin